MLRVNITNLVQYNCIYHTSRLLSINLASSLTEVRMLTAPGEPVELACHAPSYSYIMWRVKGRTSPKTVSVVNKSHLHLVGLMKESGLYQCIAFNDLTSSRANYTLINQTAVYVYRKSTELP